MTVIFRAIRAREEPAGVFFRRCGIGPAQAVPHHSRGSLLRPRQSGHVRGAGVSAAPSGRTRPHLSFTSLSVTYFFAVFLCAGLCYND